MLDFESEEVGGQRHKSNQLYHVMTFTYSGNASRVLHLLQRFVNVFGFLSISLHKFVTSENEKLESLCALKLFEHASSNIMLGMIFEANFEDPSWPTFSRHA